MPIETTCRRCGAGFEPDRRAIAAGVWRLCPACRDGDPDPEPAPVLTREGCRRPLRAGTRPVGGRCPRVPP